MKDINEKKYNINIINISYGLQEDLGEQLQNKIQGITKKKGLNREFTDSSEISEDDNNMNYYEDFLESIKKDSLENNLPKSKNSSPSSLIKKNYSYTKKQNHKDLKEKLNHEENNKNNSSHNNNYLHLQNNNDNSPHLNKSYQNNTISNTLDQNNFFKHKSNSSVKNPKDNNLLFEEIQKEKNPNKCTIKEISKFANDINLLRGSSVGTPKTTKHYLNYSKSKKVPRHSTFLIDNEQKKEKIEKKKSKNFLPVNEDNQQLHKIIVPHHSSKNVYNFYKNFNDNNINEEHVFVINQFKKKKTIKLKKSEVSINNKIDSMNTQKEQQYNNNFVTNINNPNTNKVNFGKKKNYFYVVFLLDNNYI